MMNRIFNGLCGLFLIACGDGFVTFGSGSGGSTSASSGDTVSTTVSTTVAGSGGTGGASCTSKTCQDYGFNCGTINDGCGHQLNCGTCSKVEFCNLGVCDKTECQMALEDNSKIPTDVLEKKSYFSVLNCVCHNPATSWMCGSNLESQTMCGNSGFDTGNITQKFLDNDPIGPCCSLACWQNLAGCRNQL